MNLKVFFTFFWIIFGLAVLVFVAQWVIAGILAAKVIENPNGVAEGAGKLVGTFLNAVNGK